MVRMIKHEPELVKAIFRSDLNSVREILDEDEDSVDYRDSEKRTPLHAAAYMGDPDVVRLLLEYGARVNVKDSQWLYPLHRACASSNKHKAKDIVSILLDNEADVNTRDRSLRTCLHIAAKHNSLSCVELIVNQNLHSIDISDRSGRTALHNACEGGHLEMVQLLIQNGAKVNVADKKDRRPIHVTAIQGDVQILEALVSAGADINVRDKNRMTALHLACTAGNVDMVTTLLDMEANINSRNDSGNTCWHLASLNGHTNILNELIAEGCEIDDKNLAGQTALHLATKHNVENSKSCLSLLLSEGAKVDTVDNTGRTPLHLVARHGTSASLQLLLKHTENPAEQLRKVDKKGQTCFHISAANQNLDIMDHLIQFFIKYDMDCKDEVNRPDAAGRSAVHLSAASGSLPILRKLVDLGGGNVDLGDAAGRTPIHVGAYSGSIECIEYLLSRGADFTRKDSCGKLGIHYAAATSSLTCLQALVLAGTPVDTQDSCGMTSLHLAGRHDNSGACLELLLQHSADLTIHDNKGWNVLHYAAMSGNWAAIQHILHHNYITQLVKSRHDKRKADMTTALHLAAQHGHSEALILLLSACNDPDILDGGNRTSLYLAAAMGQLEACGMLMDQGAKVVTKNGPLARNCLHAAAEKGHLEVLEKLLVSAPTATNLQDSDGMTALMLACSGGHADCVKFLLKSHADTRCTDKSGLDALNWAILSDHEAIAEYIIESCGRKVMSSDGEGRTACHFAAAKGQLKTILRIMELDSSLAKSADRSGLTPVHYAASAGHHAALQVLLNFVQAHDLWSPTFETVLHSAVRYDRTNCAKLILSTWGNKQVKNVTKSGLTALHTAATYNSLNVATMLLALREVQIDALDHKKRTPLILAAKAGHKGMVDLLVEHKASVKDQDVEGNTALHYACIKGDNSIVTSILKAMELREAEGEREGEYGAGEGTGDWVSLQNDKGKTPLHLTAGKGMVESTKMLLMADASITLTDSEGNPPALCCAKDDDTATCLAMILAAYTALPSHQYRQSLCSANSSRRSELVQRLSEYFSDLDLTYSSNLGSPLKSSMPRRSTMGGLTNLTSRKSTLPVNDRKSNVTGFTAVQPKVAEKDSPSDDCRGQEKSSPPPENGQIAKSTCGGENSMEPPLMSASEWQKSGSDNAAKNCKKRVSMAVNVQNESQEENDNEPGKIVLKSEENGMTSDIRGK